MNKNDKVLVLGSGGLVGSAILRKLENEGYSNILAPKRSELNLLIQADVLKWFEVNKPDYVFDAAAKVGGIHANNTYRADFIFQNLTIQNNIFQASFESKVKKLLFLGSSCIYPKNCPQPMKEEYLLTSPLEPTNEPYAIAKIAGLKMAESFKRQYGVNFFSVMPTNLYGENDNFHKENSHVIPGLINRMHEAIQNGDKVFKVWGTGKPRREFLYVDDLSDACVYLMNYEGELPHWVNVGTGTDVAIGELALMIKEKMGFEGDLEFDSSMPDGTMKKLLDISEIKKLGWSPSISLSEGLDKTLDYYMKNLDDIREH